MVKKINLLIIGFGNWGKSFLDILVDSEINNLIQILGIVVRDVKKHERNKDYKFYNTIEKSVENKIPNAVYIATPDFTHIKILEEIYSIFEKLKIKCPHILIEKPIGTDINLIHKTLKKFNYKYNFKGQMEPSKNSPFIMVDWHKKFSPQQRQINQLIKNDNFGNLKSIRVNYLDQEQVFSEKFLSWYKKTDLLSFLLGHYLDLIFDSIKNSKPTLVSATASYDNNNVMREVNINLGLIVPKNPNIVHVNLTISCNEPNNSYALTEQNIIYLFENSRIKIDTSGKDLEIIDKKGIHYNNVHGRSLLKDQWENKFESYGYTYDSQIRWIKTVSNIINLNETVENAIKKYNLNILPELTINACYESLKKGITSKNYKVGTGIKINLRKLSFN